MRYPTEPPTIALAGVSLTVRTGGYTALLGPKGAGKSTLLGVLGLVRRPDAGEYRLFGQATAEAGQPTRSALRSLVELVHPDPHLVPHLTAAENVELGMFHDQSAAADRHRRALALLEAVGVAGRAESPAATLSGGEKRRVAIACALAPRPSLLLIDDPHPDDLDLVDRLRADELTIVVATDDEAVAARADDVVRLSPVSV